jgi:DNA-binding NtrC family response regulator
MALFSPTDRTFAEAVSGLLYCNPFLPERIDYERQILGDDFGPRDSVWNLRGDPDIEHPNLAKILERTRSLVTALRGRLAEGSAAPPRDLLLYEDLAVYLLFCDSQEELRKLISAGSLPKGRLRAAYERTAKDHQHLLHLPARQLHARHDPAHLFACFFQVRRAFHHIFRSIVGASLAAARLRSTVWQSIFTHDIRRYRQSLYDRMGDIVTLVTGPSGTGKELVAQAIGLSQYMPFDERTCEFAGFVEQRFYPLNLSALSPTLIESELFGHRRGAFTGALDDRVGWLEVCPPVGAVFLDEVGDIDVSIQVKLLRVLQTRAFQRLGETSNKHFKGKLIAATNRDLAAAMHEGRFRNDLYYRICSDIIRTPSLRVQLAERPDELRHLVGHIAGRIAGDECGDLANEVTEWIESDLGPDYAWPGNFRELEQCVRNVLIRRTYSPSEQPPTGVQEALLQGIQQAELTADEVLTHYCTLTYARTGSYVETARRLALDRRTVKAHVGPALLEQLRTEAL